MWRMKPVSIDVLTTLKKKKKATLNSARSHIFDHIMGNLDFLQTEKVFFRKNKRPLDMKHKSSQWSCTEDSVTPAPEEEVEMVEGGSEGGSFIVSAAPPSSRGEPPLFLHGGFFLTSS